MVHATKGYCPERKVWVVPIRKNWSLVKNQRLTPTLQRKLSCTAVETGSFEKASLLAAQWGCQISDDAIRSCVLTLGKKAQQRPLSTPCAECAGSEDVLVIMMDGWLARYRGRDWGKKPHVDSQERINWHETKSAVIYRLKDQTKLSPKRKALLSKHVVATPAETDPVTFGQQVHREAMRMGLAQSARVYVVMDGGIWLWNIFQDRFKQCATGTLDFYHASQHLHTLAEALFPDGKKEAHAWCAKHLHSLKHHSSKGLFKTLAELMASPPENDEVKRAAIESANRYFQSHIDHMNYSCAARDGLPIGSGSMESQCSQFQNRLKRRGQFWSKDGFAGLLEVCVRYQNRELASLWAA